ncbi:MAG TPA: arylsulfatase, partial [Verrucomicrobia bacterium]|nr:arylsulfatase [Verrucomicrobiota bacterium]
GLALYDLTRSPDEARDVLTEYPAEVQRLQKLADRMRAELGDDLTGVAGGGRRGAGRVADESTN